MSRTGEGSSFSANTCFIKSCITLVRKPQNMLASLWSDWFSPLYLPGRLRFGGALNQLRLEGHQVGGVERGVLRCGHDHALRIEAAVDQLHHP